MRICTKYRLIIPQNIMKVITIWDTVAGISGLGVWFCGGRGAGGGGSTALNRLNDNRAFFEVRPPI